MREAGKKLEGKHDFRNFCKLNVLATTNFEREVFEVSVEKSDDLGLGSF